MFFALGKTLKRNVKLKKRTLHYFWT